MGTHRGLQVRKLYEPHLFADSAPPVRDVFDRLFGAGGGDRAGVCTVGFEPNPDLTAGLGRLQEVSSHA